MKQAHPPHRPICPSELLFNKNWMVRESNVNWVNPLLFCKQSDLSYPKNISVSPTCALMKIDWRMRVKCKLGESNYFLQEKLAYPLLLHIRPSDLFFNVNCVVCESQTKTRWTNPFLQAKQAHPPLWHICPWDICISLTKIAWCVRVMFKLGESNTFLQAKRVHPPL